MRTVIAINHFFKEDCIVLFDPIDMDWTLIKYNHNGLWNFWQVKFSAYGNIGVLEESSFQRIK
jgi:hypothetical protein